MQGTLLILLDLIARFPLRSQTERFDLKALSWLQCMQNRYKEFTQHSVFVLAKQTAHSQQSALVLFYGSPSFPLMPQRLSHSFFRRSKSSPFAYSQLNVFHLKVLSCYLIPVVVYHLAEEQWRVGTVDFYCS